VSLGIAWGVAMVLHMDTRIESGMANLALEVLNGAAREDDIRRLALMVLARKRTGEIKPATIVAWLAERGFEDISPLFRRDYFCTMWKVEHDTNVAVPLNQTANWYADSVCLAAADVALVLGETADHWLAEWFGIGLKAAKKEALRGTNAEA
jgi:hypothetical protein